jgi:hypothetical protein
MLCCSRGPCCCWGLRRGQLGWGPRMRSKNGPGANWLLLIRSATLLAWLANERGLPQDMVQDSPGVHTQRRTGGTGTAVLNDSDAPGVLHDGPQRKGPTRLSCGAPRVVGSPAAGLNLSILPKAKHSNCSLASCVRPRQRAQGSDQRAGRARRGAKCSTLQADAYVMHKNEWQPLN